jgi:hypothetical protein
LQTGQSIRIPRLSVIKESKQPKHITFAASLGQEKPAGSSHFFSTKETVNKIWAEKCQQQDVKRGRIRIAGYQDYGIKRKYLHLTQPI